MDFAFWNIISHRGFSAVLIIIDAGAQFMWLFCTSSKKYLIHIIRWSIANLLRTVSTLSFMLGDTLWELLIIMVLK
jgi:hypothetical protein